MRALYLVAGLVLAALAVVLQVVQPSETTAQTRGSFATLPAAEAALAKGDGGGALKLLIENYTRATYEGLPGVAERIRRRMSLAGESILQGKLAVGGDPGGEAGRAAWPFFETAALLSTDFDANALATESLYLERPANQVRRFVYRLTRADGSTVWGDHPDTDWAAIWPLLLQWNAVSGRTNLGGVYTEETQEWPQRAFSTCWGLGLREPERPVQFTVAVDGIRHGERVWFGTPIRFAPGEPGPEESWSFEPVPGKGSPFPTRILLFADEIPQPGTVTISLIHEYKVL